MNQEAVVGERGLAQLEQEWERATKGPWRTFERDKEWSPINSPSVNVAPSLRRRDADLIVKLFNGAPSLIAAARAGVEAEELREALGLLYEASGHSINEDEVWLPALAAARKALGRGQKLEPEERTI